MTNPLDTKKAREICDAATAGSWSQMCGYVADGDKSPRWRSVGPSVPMMASAEYDYNFITYAKTALPEALDEIEALRVEVARLEVVRVTARIFERNLVGIELRVLGEESERRLQEMRKALLVANGEVDQ